MNPYLKYSMPFPVPQRWSRGQQIVAAAQSHLFLLSLVTTRHFQRKFEFEMAKLDVAGILD